MWRQAAVQPLAPFRPEATDDARRMLADANADLAQVIEQMSDGFCVIDASWNLVACNQVHEQMTRLPRASQLGRDLRELFLREGSPEVERFRDFIGRVLATRQVDLLTAHYPPLKLWVDLRAFPLPDGGAALFYRDVSEARRVSLQRLEDQHKFAAVFETSPMALAVLRGEDLVFEHANARYRALIGGRATVGRKFTEVLHEFGAEPFAGLLLRVLRTGEPHLENERRVNVIRRPNGVPEERYVTYVYTRLSDAQGAPYGVHLFVDDVTERVRIRHQLVESLRARDDFLSFCSHELKAPLSALQLSIQALQRKLRRPGASMVTPEDFLALLARWDGHVDRLSERIDDMADFTRLHRGQVKLRLAPCNLAQVVSDTLQRLAPQLQASCVATAVTLDHAATGRWDGARLEQVCTNLLTNAVKYGDGKPVAVDVVDGPEAAILRVTDQGRGIAEVDQERIFLAYERANDGHRTNSLGLGLYICQQVVLAHGGQLTLESAPGRGACFTVRLPKNSAVAEQPGADDAPGASGRLATA